MSSVTQSLERTLPKPLYSGQHEQSSAHSTLKGVNVVGPGTHDEKLGVTRRTVAPPYGKRAGWRPRTSEDYMDGGAFPEILIAQYPLDMGRGHSTSNALAVQVDGEGRIDYTAIARQGHNEKRYISASFKDLIPLRQKNEIEGISLDRPSEEEVAATTEKTKDALAKLVSEAVQAQKPSQMKHVTEKRNAKYVRYTPAQAQMGNAGSRKNDRIMKIVERPRDPFEPPRHKAKKIPRGPPSPPPPILHSPPRKLTAEDQEAWKIPPPVSNWKNPKGYTVALDKRLAADGRGLQDVTISDKFAQFAEALFTADRHARDEVKQRAQMQQKLAEKEKEQKEQQLRELAHQAREDRSGTGRSRARRDSYTSESSSDDDEATRERERVRRERRQENERQLRQSRMGTERRIQQIAREQNRDISEKVALGLAKPTQAADTMYDSRLFNHTSGFDTGFNEDQAYDKPLFAAQDAINSIYRPSANADDEDQENASSAELNSIQKANRFDVLGKAAQGFRGAADAEARQGPVQFEKDQADPFGIDAMIQETVGAGGDQHAGSKRLHLQDQETPSSKKARVGEGKD